MTTAEDLKSTLNLPRTDFPMKANLPQAEPRRIALWKEQGLYERLRAARAGAPRFILHDGPPYANGHIHLGTALNKVLKDVIVRSRSMLGAQGHDAPYVPGWDCHGLPIELQVDRNLGSKKRDMSPVAFRRECRAYAEKFVDIQRQEFERLGVMGEWSDPYLTMAPGYQATIVRQLAEFVEKGLVYKAKKSVHWCISDRTALAEAEIEYDEKHTSPSIDVKLPLCDADLETLASTHPALHDRDVSAVIWTTTPWTLPANLAVAFHPDADYALYPVEGSSEVLIIAKALREAALARWKERPVTLGEPLAEMKGSTFEGLRFRHPWIDRDSVGVLGDYVTLDTGTGVVHTAPGHGWDDYLTGVKYGLEIYCPVDEAGRFLPEVAFFAGQKVFDANPKVIELLREKGALLGAGKETHSYPICWRCKNPIIFRATYQWFIGLDIDGFRERALDAIAKVRWYPAWGEERIRNMIAARPDWCISRQRLWGVPIPAFYCEGCSAALLTPEIARHVADLFEADSADAWWAREAKDLLPPGFVCPKCGGQEFDKEKDILDVWFDSGSSHAAVLARRPGLRWPADVYLEGSDQHRGWFHSSLLIGVGTRGRAPYDQVITHGFTVDGQGRKISKSMGNDVDTQKLIQNYGAEIVRLWVTMVDYRDDMPFSDEMIKRVAEAYRKIRNTCRYLLSNLFDFDPAKDAVPEDRLEEIDQYALARHRQVLARVLEAYGEFEFHIVYHQLVQYCAADLSSFYLDVLKDRLYCDAPGGARRRSSQTVLHRMARDLARLMAPILPMTADEVWQSIPGAEVESVHLALFPDVDGSIEDRKLWSALLEARAAVTKALEEARAAKKIASSLEARVEVAAPSALLEPLREYQAQGRVFPGNLANLFIVSDVTLTDAEGALSVRVERARGAKCERCWTYSENVGKLPAHPAVCERCSAVLEGLGR
ncbi:MAG TPA: isoleucine--tRNA ligase [Vicinamibacteria bacterium]|nr:isoleucine--tRNA ligase [Vicinamibacteria bacterium]